MRIYLSVSGNDCAFILLATYNGERFLREQIESIQAQSHPDWLLLVHDDGSSDGTPDLLRRFASADPRITILPVANGRLGAAASFERLADNALQLGARYAFFCDQDDVWLARKIAAGMKALAAAEAESGSRTPILVHSDLRVVDESLRPVHESYRDFNGVSYDRDDPLATLVLHNAVVGCTAGFNRALLQAALPFPAHVHHDWWMAQCAAAGGRVIDSGDATVLYRQHAANVIGARGRHAFVPDAVRRPRQFVTNAFAAFDAGVRQAYELQRRVNDRPESFRADARERVESYCDGFRRDFGVVRRLRRLASSGIRPQRLLSFPILYALAAVYPHVRTT